MFRSLHRFLLLTTACLLLLGSPGMAQQSKNILVLYGNNAELPWIEIFDASLRAEASASTKYRIEFFTDTKNIVAMFDVSQEPRKGKPYECAKKAC